MTKTTAYQRRDCLQRVAYWLRCCQDQEAIDSPSLTRRFVNKAREAMDELMLDMFGDEQESEAEAVQIERTA